MSQSRVFCPLCWADAEQMPVRNDYEYSPYQRLAMHIVDNHPGIVTYKGHWSCLCCRTTMSGSGAAARAEKLIAHLVECEAFMLHRLSGGLYVEVEQ